jgi:hypothetical protein
MRVKTLYKHYIRPRLDSIDDPGCRRRSRRLRVPPDNQVEKVYETSRAQIQEEIVVLRKAFCNRPFWALCNQSESLDDLQRIVIDDTEQCLVSLDCIRRELLQFRANLDSCLSPSQKISAPVVDGDGGYCFITRLPTEMVEGILRYLTFPESIRLAFTCRRLHYAIISNSNLWKRKCKEMNINADLYAIGRLCRSDKRLWFELYTRSWLGSVPVYKGNPCSICRKRPAVPSTRKWESIDSQAIVRWKFCERCYQMMFVSEQEWYNNGLGLDKRILRWYRKKLSTNIDPAGCKVYFFEDLLELHWYLTKKNKKK